MPPPSSVLAIIKFANSSRLASSTASRLCRTHLTRFVPPTLKAIRSSAKKLSTHTNAKKIRDLVKLKAIGPEIATVLAGEVFYRPFSSRRELASYVGLTPSHFQSGARRRDQGLDKAAKARGAMIELAWM
jgi:transposase